MTIRRPALLVGYGPEARAFLQSGFYEGLVRLGMQPVVFSYKPLCPAFADVPNEALRQFPQAAETKGLQRLRNFSRRVQGRGMTGWTERTMASFVGGSAAWRNVFAEAHIDALICASSNSVRTLPALQTAANLGLPSIVLENSWKDSPRRAYAPTTPTVVGLTTHAAAQAFTAGNRMGLRQEVCGSLHLSALAVAPQLNRIQLCARLGLDTARPVVCFSAARAEVGSAESRWLTYLWRCFSSIEAARRPQLLIRTNPMDCPNRFAELEGLRDLVVSRPLWDWDAEGDWCCPLPEDASLWVSVIQLSALNISLPSTVTMEFAAFGRPVINVVLDRYGRELFDSSFYSEARKNGWARAAASLPELAQAVLQQLKTPSPSVQSAPCLDAARRAVALVQRASTKPHAAPAAAFFKRFLHT